jgi:hypothetical protein
MHSLTSRIIVLAIAALPLAGCEAIAIGALGGGTSAGGVGRDSPLYGRYSFPHLHRIPGQGSIGRPGGTPAHAN